MLDHKKLTLNGFEIGALFLVCGQPKLECKFYTFLKIRHKDSCESGNSDGEKMPLSNVQ